MNGLTKYVVYVGALGIFGATVGFFTFGSPDKQISLDNPGIQTGGLVGVLGGLFAASRKEQNPYA